MIVLLTNGENRYVYRLNNLIGNASQQKTVNLRVPIVMRSTSFFRVCGNFPMGNTDTKRRSNINISSCCAFFDIGYYSFFPHLPGGYFPLPCVTRPARVCASVHTGSTGIVVSE